MKHIFFLLLIINSIFAVNIDKTWFDNTNEELKKLYEQQASKLNEIPNKNDETKEQIDYQKLLLKKLNKKLDEPIKLSFDKIDNISSMEEYINTIKIYIDTKTKISNFERELKQNSSKLQTLEEQIDKLTDKQDIITINSQLLFAFYTLENKQNKEQITQLGTYSEELKKILLASLSAKKLILKDDFDKKLDNFDNELSQLIKDEKKLLLAYDKTLISENENKLRSLERELSKIRETKQNLLDNFVFLKIEKILIELQNKSNNYFDENKNLVSFIEANKIDYKYLLDLFKYLSREYIGITKSTIVDTKESFVDILKFGWNEINKPYIPLGNGVSILDIAKFLFIFIFGFFVASLYRKKISQANLKNSSPATKTMLANLGFYFLVFITFVFALNSIGIDLSSLTILVGALSVGIGFGLQNIVSNFISGIILIFEKSIQVGNIIEIENELRGRVTQINMRSSVITTFDNIDIIIPNSTLMQNNVVNLTFADDIRRLHIPFGVAYGSDAKDVIKIILEELGKSELIYIKDDIIRKPSVWMTGMGASSVDFKLLVWINSNTNKSGLDSSGISDFLIFIYETLNKYNIEIPFPQMDVHLKK